MWPISSHLDQTSLVNKRFVTWHKEHTEKTIFLLFFFFRALKRKPVICKSDGMIWVSHFSSFILTEKSQKFFLLARKILLLQMKNFQAPTSTPGKCYYGNKTGYCRWAVTLHHASSSSQSQCGIWFILPAHEVCHIVIKINY